MNRISPIKLTVQDVVNLQQSLSLGLAHANGILRILEAEPQYSVQNTRDMAVVRSQIEFIEQTINQINEANDAAK